MAWRAVAEAGWWLGRVGTRTEFNATIESLPLERYNHASESTSAAKVTLHEARFAVWCIGGDPRWRPPGRAVGAVRGPTDRELIVNRISTESRPRRALRGNLLAVGQSSPVVTNKRGDVPRRGRAVITISWTAHRKEVWRRERSASAVGPIGHDARVADPAAARRRRSVFP